MDGGDTVLFAMLMKPFVVIVFCFFFALGVWLTKRYAPEWLRRILLRKLW